MPRHLRPATLLLSAALIAGCGGSGSSAPAARAPSQAAPAPGAGQLRVGATDLHLGDATATDRSGLRELSRRRVPSSAQSQQGVGAGATCRDTEVVPSSENLGTVAASTLCLLNGERADAGLKALTQNGRLARAAGVHSREMVRQQYFDHVAKSGSDAVDRIRAAGYMPRTGTWTVGENLAWGTGTMGTPKAIVAAWMKSQGQRENILRPAFRQIGFGVVAGNPRSSNGSGATYTTTFGSLSGASAAHAASASGASARARKARRARIARRARRARLSRR
ncbi:MAG: CAP domain-containing protein [Solirubrobacteraceae bacterium]